MLGFSNVQNKVDLSVALNDIRSEKIDKILIEKDNLILTYKDGSTKLTTKEAALEINAHLAEQKLQGYSVKHLIKLISRIGFKPGKPGRIPKK